MTDTNSAELIKHASNSFLAMKISFINMVSDLCEVVGADVTRVAEGMGMDPRIGPAFLNPGIGFGGFCFPKDVQAFIRIAEKSGCDFSLLKEVERINHGRIENFVKKVQEELWVVRGKKLARLGSGVQAQHRRCAFRPIDLSVQALLREGAIVRAYDPKAMEKAKAELPEISSTARSIRRCRRRRCNFDRYGMGPIPNVDWHRLKAVVEQALIVDGRNMFDPDEVARNGFRYVSVGRQACREWTKRRRKQRVHRCCQTGSC